MERLQNVLSNLEKIEELFLYLIETQKEMASLKAQNEALKLRLSYWRKTFPIDGIFNPVHPKSFYEKSLRLCGWAPCLFGFTLEIFFAQFFSKKATHFRGWLSLLSHSLLIHNHENGMQSNYLNLQQEFFWIEQIRPVLIVHINTTG